MPGDRDWKESATAGTSYSPCPVLSSSAARTRWYPLLQWRLTHCPGQTRGRPLLVGMLHQRANGRLDQPFEPLAQPDIGRPSCELLERIQVHLFHYVAQQ